MRQLRISTILDSIGKEYDNEELKKQIIISSDKHHQNDGKNNFLEEVRNGERESIFKLVEDSEIFILIAISDELAKGEFSIQQLFDVGKQVVTKLAERELNSTRRERFYSFLSLEVKNAIQRIKDDIK